jgi:hypothetical protein
MPDYTVPDRQLAELWKISERMVELIREDVAALKAQAAIWEPAPIPNRKEFP